MNVLEIWFRNWAKILVNGLQSVQNLFHKTGLKLSLLLCSIILLGAAAKAQSVQVVAAADLRYAMDEIVVAYKKIRPNADIRLSYGSSGNAYQQIVNGAPYDIYFSADIMYPKKLHEKGLTATKPQLYALGFIVLWSSTIDVSVGMNALTDPRIRKIAIANPSHAPYGQRAQESLQYYKLHENIKTKLIMGENIAQAAQFTQTGNAEIGILALSLALSPGMLNKGKYFVIDTRSYSPLEQAFVITKRAKSKPEVHMFAQYIASAQAREILKKYGFQMPMEDKTEPK